MTGSMPSGTYAEHLGLNAVGNIDKLSIMLELYSRLENVRYYRKIGNLGAKPESHIMWGQFVNNLKDYL